MKKRMLMLPILFAIAGCGGGSPLTFWLITVDQTPPAVCVPAPTTAPTNTDTQSNLEDSSTWELYQGDKDSAGADTYILTQSSGGGSGTAIVGSKSGSKYTFTGTDTQVQKSPTAEAPTATVTNVTTTTVTFTVDGSTMSGTESQATTSSCAGSACPTGGTPPPCSQSSTTTTTFHGAQVSATIQHNV